MKFLQKFFNLSKVGLRTNYYEKEIPRIKNYISLLRSGYFNSSVYYNQVSKPKISFISTVYNKEIYLNSFICSIQNQNLKEFELIIVDDCSTDKSVEIIKNFQLKDRRIKLLINKNNKQALYSRYKGAIYGKGKYFYFVDSDDIILKKGITNSYNFINKNNLDMIQFNSLWEKNNKTFINRRSYKYITIIYQPILKYIYYYKNNSGIENNYCIWDKLIKKKVVFKSIRYIGTKFLNKRIIIENDVVLLFSFFRNSNSFKYIDELCYYSNRNNIDSIYNSRVDLNKSNELIYSIFSNIEFFYDKTGKTKFSKYFCLFKLFQGYYRYINCFKYSTNNTLEKVLKILNKLLESNYISPKHKILIGNISSNISLIRNTNLVWKFL